MPKLVRNLDEAVRRGWTVLLRGCDGGKCTASARLGTRPFDLRVDAQATTVRAVKAELVSKINSAIAQGLA